MRIRVTLAALAVALLASLGATATAGAAPKDANHAAVVGNVKINKDGTGTVKAHYRCVPGEGWHLWASAKQTSDGSRDEAILQEGAGFGGLAPTWLQQHPTTFTCDGKWHTQKFVIDKTEVGPDGQPIGRGQLVKGWAYVQLCLIKFGSETEEPEVFLADQEWRKVR